MEMCIVTTIWPNANASQVTEYRILANDSFVLNTTNEISNGNNEIRISSLFLVSSCTTHNVSVSVVNVCDDPLKVQRVRSMFRFVPVDCDILLGNSGVNNYIKRKLQQ